MSMKVRLDIVPYKTVAVNCSRKACCTQQQVASWRSVPEEMSDHGHYQTWRQPLIPSPLPITGLLYQREMKILPLGKSGTRERQSDHPDLGAHIAQFLRSGTGRGV